MRRRIPSLCIQQLSFQQLSCNASERISAVASTSASLLPSPTSALLGVRFKHEKLRDMAKKIDKDDGLKRLRQIKADIRDQEAIAKVLQPMTPRQIKYASRLQLALNLALEKQHEARDSLVRRLGFTIKEVRISEDLREAYIRWSCFPGLEDEAADILRTVDKKIDHLAYRKYKSWMFPRLLWRTDGAAETHRRIEDAFEELAAQEETEAFEELLEKVYGADRAESIVDELDASGQLEDAARSVGRALGEPGAGAGQEGSLGPGGGLPGRGGRVGSRDLQRALAEMEREDMDMERRRIQGLLDKPNLRHSVRSRLSERLAALERPSTPGPWGPGGLGLQGDPDAAREDDLLEAVGALDVMDPREALEFRLAQMEEAVEEGTTKEPGEEGALSCSDSCSDASSESSEPEVGPGPRPRRRR